MVVPTYKTPSERLDALVASLDAQTIDRAEWELLLVDDGSGPETLELLRAAARDRDNVRVIPMEGSGWACRPRNEGTRQARGDWVLYMDHDDVLFPDALRRLRDFAATAPLDVINPKEVRTRLWAWGWDHFVADSTETSSLGIEALLPMTPHKLYRRAFLREHDIAFIEGARVLWEDVFFNCRAYAAGARIGVLASYPVYHWVETGENSSADYDAAIAFGGEQKSTPDPETIEEIWSSVERLLRYFAEVLPEPDADRMRAHWLRTRVVGGAARALAPEEDRDPAQAERARALMDELIPEHVEALLAPVDRVLAARLRAGRLDEFRAVALDRLRIGVNNVARGIRFDDSGIDIDIETELLHGQRRYELLAETGAALLELGGERIDVTEELDSTRARVSVRGKSSREFGPLRSGAAAELDRDGDRIVPRLAFTARVDLDELSTDRARPRQRWELAVRVQLPGQSRHRGLRTTERIGELGHATPAGVVLVRDDSGGLLSVELVPELWEIVRRMPEGGTATATTRGSMTTIAVALPPTEITGSLVMPLTLSLRALDASGASTGAPRIDVPARLLLDAGSLRAETEPLRLARGDYRVTLRQGERARGITTVTVEKTLAQRIASTAAARLHR
ncbi:MAG: glycosyltransferase [Microbacteriaceae bacterium]